MKTTKAPLFETISEENKNVAGGHNDPESFNTQPFKYVPRTVTFKLPSQNHKSIDTRKSKLSILKHMLLNKGAISKNHFKNKRKESFNATRSKKTKALLCQASCHLTTIISISITTIIPITNVKQVVIRKWHIGLTSLTTKNTTLTVWDIKSFVA